jgi:hypothetical protein
MLEADRTRKEGRTPRPSRSIAWTLSTLLVAALAFVAAPATAGWKHHYKKPRACSSSAKLGFVACKFDIKDDFFEASAICANESERDARNECFDEALDERRDGSEECDEVKDARLDVCDELGEEPYAPDYDPADFETVFDDLNPYFPLAPGNTWTYEGGDEVITVEVTDKTKLIDGLTCLVVNDTASEDGSAIEITDDWYAQASDGTVVYCGEISFELETFEGDDPEEPEVVSVDGSWKAGRDGAQAGVAMQGDPEPGQVYRQEWAFGEAEDIGEVISDSYGYGNDAELDYLVPQALAEHLCSGDDCVVTVDTTPLEPDANERKYYAPGVGVFLEVDLVEDTVTVLTECNVDPLCDTLP